MEQSWRDQMKKNLRDWSSGDTFKFKEGETVFRVLPNKKGLKFPPVVLFLTHPNVGKNSSFARCGKSLQGQGKCWLCDEKLPALLTSDKPQVRAAAEKMRPVRNAVLQVSSIVDGKWTVPKPLYCTVSKRALGNRILTFITSGTRAYDDPVEGYNLILERNGQGMKTQYGDLQAEESPTKVPQGVLARLKDFSELLAPYSAQSQKEILYGKEQEQQFFEDESSETETSFNEEPAAEEVAEEVTEDVAEESEEVTEGEEVSFEDDEMATEEDIEEVVESPKPIKKVVQKQAVAKSAVPAQQALKAPAKPTGKPVGKPKAVPKPASLEEEEIEF